MNVLVLLASYNGEKYIARQLDSILKQQSVNITVFVSDDGSTDSTLDIINSYQDRVYLLPLKKPTGSAGQNFLRLLSDVDCSNYDYIAFADQDDVWLDNKLMAAVEKLESENADAYSSNVIAFWKDGKKKLINKVGVIKQFDHLFSAAGPGCSYVFKAEVILDLQAWLISHLAESKLIELHDWLAYAYVRHKGYKWIIDTNSYMLYRQHDNNVMGANVGVSAIKSRWHKCRNGWYREQIVRIAEFCNINNKVVFSLKRNNYFDRLYLALSVFKFRRKFSESIFLMLALLVPGFK